VITSTRSDLMAASVHATGPAEQAVASIGDALQAGLAGRTASVVIYFASSSYQPEAVAGPLSRRFPGAAVIGCSTAGEFTDAANGTGGISAVALPEGIIVRTAAALGELGTDVAAGADAAVDAVERALGEPLRGLDPARHLAFVLIDGMHGSEELVNERIGNAAPILDVVGGSAGDDLAFERTWVAVGDRVSYHGVAALVVETGVPFRIVKTCSFTPSGRQLTITKADLANRTVLEFDGQPAVEAYAHALGIPIEAVDTTAFMAHPVGLMIDGKPWIRSPHATVEGGGIAFLAQVLEGMQVDVMDAGDLVGETGAAIGEAVADLGGASGAVMFNCILRRLQLDAEGTGDAFVAAFDGLPLAGFHTYGETWLGHVNQTLTGVVFG
jgi:hypothetical protein